jgi:hypothetical protein
MRRTSRRAPRTLALVLLLALGFLPATLVAQKGARGTFTLRVDQGDRVELQLVPDARDPDRSPLVLQATLAEIRGLSRDQLSATGQAPLQFMIAREAGTFVLQGPTGRGEASGRYVFMGDDFYARALARRLYTRPRDPEQARLAAADVQVALVDELRALGYARPTVHDMVRLGEHGVTLAFAQGLADAGVRLRRAAELLAFRDHGVSLEWVTDMRRAGYGDVPPMELLRMRDRGVDAQFIAQLAAAGYSALSVDDAIMAREHGIDSSFAQAFRREGFFELTLTDLIQLREHGVSAGFARRVRERSGTTPSADDLVNAARAHDEG